MQIRHRHLEYKACFGLELRCHFTQLASPFTKQVLLTTL